MFIYLFILIVLFNTVQSATQLVDILGQQCSTSKTPVDCPGPISRFMFLDNDTYKYACYKDFNNINIPIPSADVTYYETDYISIDFLSKQVKKPTRYAKEITISNNFMYITGVFIGNVDASTSSNQYVINIPIYQPTSNKLVKSTNQKAYINLGTIFSNGFSITSITTTQPGSTSSYIKEGNVYYIVST